MNLPEILIGCDPEVFLSGPSTVREATIQRMFQKYVAREEKAQAKYEWLRGAPIFDFEGWKEFQRVENPKFLQRPFVSAHGLIPGTKAEPFPVEDGAIQVDGVALEFNITPAKTAEQFNTRIGNVLRQMEEKLGRPELQFEFKPTATFSAAVWKKIPDEAKVLGCEPDYNGYTLEANPKPETDKPFRTASGHIHLGWCEGKDVTSGAHINDCGLLAKQLDIVLGMFSPGWDDDDQRRQLYGQPGAFRPKPYGMEYRSLSNRWLAFENMPATIFHNARLALKLLFKGRYLPGMFPHVSSAIHEDGFKRAFYGMEEFYDVSMYLASKGHKLMVNDQ